MTHKKIAAAIVSAAMLFSASSCGKNEDALKILRIGSEYEGYPPFEYVDDTGEHVGIDIDIGKKLGEKMGIEVEFVATDWDGIFAGLDRGEYDCVMSAVTINEERLESFDFSVPYIQNFQCFITLKGADVKPLSPDDIGGLRIGFQEATTSEEFINDYANEKSIKFEACVYSKMTDAFSELENGRLDAIICDSTVASTYLSSGKFEQTWVQNSNPEEFGICFKKGSTELIEKVNKALSEMKSDGTLDSILNKYF